MLFEAFQAAAATLVPRYRWCGKLSASKYELCTNHGSEALVSMGELERTIKLFKSTYGARHARSSSHLSKPTYNHSRGRDSRSLATHCTRCPSIPRRLGESLQRRVSNKSIAGLASLQRQSNMQHASRKYKCGFLFHNFASVSLQSHTTFEKHEPMIDQFYLPVLHSPKESHACTITRSSPTLLHSDSEVGWR